MGNQAFAQKNYEEAIEFYNKAIELNPSDATFYSNRSGCYASMEKYAEALSDAEKAIQSNPNFIKGYSRKGFALIKLGKEEEALEAYDAGLKVDPSNEQLLKDKASIEQGAQQSMGDLMGLLNNPEIKKMMSENPQMLQTLLQNPALFKDPTMLANMMNMFGKKGKAPSQPTPPSNQDFGQSNPWDKEHEDDPSSSVPKKDEEKPKMYSETPKHSQSASHQSEFELTKTKADGEYKKKNFEAAIGHYDECIKIDSNNLLAYNNKAACLIELKKWEEALATVNQALEQSKEMDFKHRNYQHLAKVLSRKGRIYHLQHNYKEAIKFYEDSLLEDRVPATEEYVREAKRAIKKEEEQAYLDPSLSEKHREMGNELFTKGDFGAAITEYEEAKKRNPKDPKVYNNIAMCFIKIMKFNEAMKEVEKAIELDPKFIKAILRKAAIHNFLKEHHKALDAYNKVLQLEPNNGEAKEGLHTTEMKISSSMNEGNDEERTKRAMNDPEVVSIMSDPMVRIALEQMQANPRNAMEYMSDRTLGPKIQKLIAAGIIKTK